MIMRYVAVVALACVYITTAKADGHLGAAQSKVLDCFDGIGYGAEVVCLPCHAVCPLRG